MKNLLLPLVAMCLVVGYLCPMAQGQVIDAERSARLEEQLRHTETDLQRTQRAAAIAGAVTAGLRCLIDLALMGGLVAATVIAERHRRERDDERARRCNLTRIVQAADKFTLLKDDKQMRQGAREFAGEAAHRELKLALALPNDPAAGAPPTP